MTAILPAKGPAICHFPTDCFGHHVGARAQQIANPVVGVAIICSTATGAGADEGRGNSDFTAC